MVCSNAPQICIGRDYRCGWNGILKDKVEHELKCQSAEWKRLTDKMNTLKTEKMKDLKEMENKYDQQLANLKSEKLNHMQQLEDNWFQQITALEIKLNTTAKTIMQSNGINNTAAARTFEAFSIHLQCSVSIGMELDCLDSALNWCLVRVLDIRIKPRSIELFLHFIGWAERWRQYMDIDDRRLAIKNTHVTQSAEATARKRELERIGTETNTTLSNQRSTGQMNGQSASSTAVQQGGSSYEEEEPCTPEDDDESDHCDSD
jgi:uncharacterized protein YdcH (DUF465 family)